ncbi:MAG: DUF1697 domain-containing protein [Spirosomaceae bacterium]|nr:DUF1697 domain-containing protein [Spirosomataceae bacterium]
MQTYIAILRGINVGGKRKILMADLKALFAEMGFSEIETYIQSGNVFFKAKRQENSELAQSISSKIQQQYEFDVPVIVKTATELQNAFAENPFVDSAEIEQLHVTFLSEIPVENKLQEIASLDFSPDQFQIVGENVYLKCVNKYHQTKLSNNFFEKKLGVSATTRNWKTVTKLVELVKG